MGSQHHPSYGVGGGLWRKPVTSAGFGFSSAQQPTTSTCFSQMDFTPLPSGSFTMLHSLHLSSQQLHYGHYVALHPSCTPSAPAYAIAMACPAVLLMWEVRGIRPATGSSGAITGGPPNVQDGEGRRILATLGAARPGREGSASGVEESYPTMEWSFAWGKWVKVTIPVTWMAWK